MTEPDFERLAHAHMAQQVREAGTVQAALARLWDRMIDPNDFQASYLRFREASLPLIGAGRIRSEALAQEYYSGVMAAAGYDDPLALVARQPLDHDVTKSVMTKAVDPAYAAFKIGRGDPVALSVAKAAMLGAVKRQALNGGRQRLIAIANADKNVRGWGRVSDGKPCSFCAMLVSRGPVYTASSVHFRSHIKCGCSVRLVTRNDKTGGWTSDARAFRKLFDASGGDPKAFRSALAEARSDPTSGPAQILTDAA